MTKTEAEIMAALAAGCTYTFVHHDPVFGRRMLAAAERLRSQGQLTLIERQHPRRGCKAYECRPLEYGE